MGKSHKGLCQQSIYMGHISGAQETLECFDLEEKALFDGRMLRLRRLYAVMAFHGADCVWSGGEESDLCRW